jgi:RNase P subunit RPR2
MTIEVLRPKTEERTYDRDCRHCGARLRFKASDGDVVSDREGVAVRIICPECRHELWTGINAGGPI